MKPVRRIARILAVPWLLFVVAVGVGGTWLAHNEAGVAEGALALVGVDVETIERKKRENQAVATARREARSYVGAGWGDDAVPYQDEQSDWDR